MNLSLGCHNLTGGSSYRRAHRLVACALELGIRRFDVAPSYGLGTAERTLAHALGPRRNDTDIEITTKFGIAAPRLGFVAAWLREPYRALRRIGSMASGSALAPAQIKRSPQPPTPFQGTAQSAVEASLRALRIDRLGVLLSHERLGDNLSERFADDMAEMLGSGIVGRVGCSGDGTNVRHMLARSRGLAAIAQLALHHQVQLQDYAPDAGVLETRLFNLAKFARVITPLMPSHTLGRDLVDVVPARLCLAPVGAALAGVVAWFGVRQPAAVLIINASTDARLLALVVASREHHMRNWAETYDADLQSLFSDIV